MSKYLPAVAQGSSFEEYHINMPYMESFNLSMTDQLESLSAAYGGMNNKFAIEEQIKSYKRSQRTGQAKGGFIKYANKRKGLLDK